LAARDFLIGGEPPPPAKIDHRAAADTMTSAYGSTCKTMDHT